MQLSKITLSKLSTRAGVQVPSPALFMLPEKVLQFGTGVLLRGLPDYLIHVANTRGVFNGRIVVVKSTLPDDVSVFSTQDCLYTLSAKGVSGGQPIEDKTIISAISRVIPAGSEWPAILDCAENPALELIISNTTETGIRADWNDDPLEPHPRSFPSRLLAFLYQRYRLFKGDTSKGLVIVPTELITDNGDVLRSILLELTEKFIREPDFEAWLESSNHFCNSLVDRIVPGKLSPEMQKVAEAEIGYTDDLMIMCEPYRLWAIETKSDHVKQVLSFCSADEGAQIVHDLSVIRELKLRLLNGVHSFMCGVAHLAGFATVYDCASNRTFKIFMLQLAGREIVSSVVSEKISGDVALQYAGTVIERFSNPFIQHQWLSISAQYSSKMKTRTVPVIERWLNTNEDLPPAIAISLAGFLLFMKCELYDDGNYYGVANGTAYLINDENAEWYSTAWTKTNSARELVQSVLGNSSIWGSTISSHRGVLDAVALKLEEMINFGAAHVINQWRDSAA